MNVLDLIADVITSVIITALAYLTLVLVVAFVRACIASWHEYREDQHKHAQDDEWLARQNIAPLSSTVDRVGGHR